MVDHLTFSTEATFEERVFVNADHWTGGGGPIFFYAGNEDDVTLYVNATGLMWEHAAEFGALLCGVWTRTADPLAQAQLMDLVSFAARPRCSGDQGWRRGECSGRLRSG